MPTAITASRPCPSRQFHCVDVENLLGLPRFTSADVTALKSQYCATAQVDASAQITLATSHSNNLLTAGLAWAGTRRVWSPGRDGADLALLSVLEEDKVTERFEHVIIGSGDGIFATAAARLAARGCHVTVVSRQGHLSGALRMAAHDVLLLDLYAPSATLVAGRAA